MTIQDAVWRIALAAIGLIALGFIYVISQASRPADEAETRRATNAFHGLRRGLFLILLVGFVAGTWATLRRFPIPRQRGDLGAAQVVDVTARMWSWQVTPATVQAGNPVEFRVTSGDVNHGFAIYTPDGRILTQTQAMPGYTNKLLWTFDQPGTYTLQCLEFCGVGHAHMTTTLEVVAARGE